jgi:histidinol-phosphatase (PHP family)
MRERFARPDHDWWGGTVAVYCGLELGIQRHTIDQNARLVTAHKDELDFVLLSCHQIDNLEFWQGDYQRGRQPEQITQAYYEELYACQRSFHDYSCLAHLDAIKRDNPGDRRPFAAYRDLVAAILEQAIADGKGIELNTSSVRYGLSDWQPCKES